MFKGRDITETNKDALRDHIHKPFFMLEDLIKDIGSDKGQRFKDWWNLWNHPLTVDKLNKILKEKYGWNDFMGRDEDNQVSE